MISLKKILKETENDDKTPVLQIKRDPNAPIGTLDPNVSIEMRGELFQLAKENGWKIDVQGSDIVITTPAGEQALVKKIK